MPVAYKVTITSTKTLNTFQVIWLNLETNTEERFDQSASNILPEEMNWLWKKREYQLRIGKKLYCFLNGDSHCLERALKEAADHGESLRVYLSTCNEVTNWPFELLAKEEHFLLPKMNILHVIRSIPDWGEIQKLPPENRCLKVLFMACAPLDLGSKLEYEKEENAIFKITEKLAIDLTVEDTGSLGGLGEKLGKCYYDIVHLSGWTNFNKKRQPNFVMENATGTDENVSVEQLWKGALEKNPPRFLFLSGRLLNKAPEGSVVSFAHKLMEKFAIPSVLGWGRPVSNGQAGEASKMMYKELSRGKSIIHAVQRARNLLIKRFYETPNPAWPLLRLFSRGMNLNPIVEVEQRWNPQPRRMTHIYLNDSNVKVLDEGFVGRRRQLQQSFRALELDKKKWASSSRALPDWGKAVWPEKFVNGSQNIP